MAEDQGDIAWGYILRQHANKEKFESFFRAFYDPLTGFANEMDKMSRALVLDEATGERLDLIGSIVGASRDVPEGLTIPLFGFDGYAGSLGFGVGRLRRFGEPVSTTYTMADNEYRIIIGAKIALNNARGTAPEIEEAARIAYSAPSVSVRDDGNATCTAWIARAMQADDPLFYAVPKLLGRMAGVKLNVVFFDVSTPFGFEGYPDTFGFPHGVLSRAAAGQ